MIPEQYDYELDLDELRTGIVRVVPPDASGYFISKCVRCLHEVGHNNPTIMDIVKEDTRSGCLLKWDYIIDNDFLAAHADLVEATDPAACAIALLFVEKYTEFRIVEQAPRGNGIDYFIALRDQAQDDNLIFNNASRMEVSGILRETRGNSVADRKRDKINRLNKYQVTFETLIVIVEFSNPIAEISTYAIR